jgi:benzoyl-CoA reductase/2-hydroxyglutaryl-CoA dehydratase subunit BcrC/BadD/HgdB
LYNQQRRLLATLYERRGPAQQRWALTTASMLMPVTEHNALLQSFLDGAAGASSTADERPAVLLVGAILDDPAILQLVEELGGRVVGDDLCTGSRFFEQLVDETKEPYVALTERYMQRPSCPAKHNPTERHAERLQQLRQDTSAQGVVFVLPKFCDPHAFDYVPLRADLSQAGVPHLLIETDVTTPTGQLRTRLQAFLEMLR